MFNSIMHVREICQERKIPISTLEKECGCGNGYFNPKKQKSISYEKAVAVADYLGLSVEYIMTGEKEQPSTAEGEGLLDAELVRDLLQLTPAEAGKVRAFVKGLLAGREV